MVKRIHVHYHLRAALEHREIAERVLGFHADNCPVARTIRNCVEISISLEFKEV